MMSEFNQLRVRKNKVRGGQIIFPFARNIVRSFCLGFLCVVFLASILCDVTNIWWGGVLTGLGGVLVYLSTRTNVRYYTPILLSLLYVAGYMLPLLLLSINYEQQRTVGFGGAGAFVLSDAGFPRVAIAICSGIMGIFAAMLLMEHRGAGHREKKLAIIDNPLIITDILRMKIYVIIWFIFSLSAILLMSYLGIGRVGLIDQEMIKLPFKLRGLLYFARLGIVPFLGIYFFSYFFSSDNKRWTLLLLMMLTAIGVVGSILSMSRSYFTVFIVLPVLIYMIFNIQKNDWKKKLLFRFVIGELLILLCVVTVVQALRDYGYTVGEVNVAESINYRKSKDSTTIGDIMAFTELATNRVIGMKELILVSSSDVSNISATKAILFEETEYAKLLTYIVFGYNPTFDDVRGFGISFGLWGMLFLSGSYLVVFMGTMLICCVVMIVEEMFFRKGLNCAACLSSVILCHFFWEYVGINYPSRFLVSLWCAYIIVKIINSTKKSARFRTTGQHFFWRGRSAGCL